MWVHMKPNPSFNLFRYFNFLRCCWGLTSLPMVTLYRPFFPNIICISSLQSIKLKSGSILGVKAVELSILQLQETTNYSENLQLTYKNSSIRNQTNSNTPPLWHVHFLWVHHTWLDFSRHNPEGVRQEYQDLCGTQLLLVHQWKFLRFFVGLNTYFDTMLNLMKHGSSGLNEILSEKKDTKELTIQCKFISRYLAEITHTRGKSCP